MIFALSVKKAAESFQTLEKLFPLAEFKEVVIVRKKKGSQTTDPLKS